MKIAPPRAPSPFAAQVQQIQQLRAQVNRLLHSLELAEGERDRLRDLLRRAISVSVIGPELRREVAGALGMREDSVRDA